MAKILILDDDKVLCSMLYEELEREGHSAIMTHNLKRGLERVHQESFDIVLLDVQLPDGNGLEYLPRFMQAPSEPEVIIITGQGEADGAEHAIVSGAWSYIEKPHVIRELGLHLTRALQYRREKQKVTEVPVALKRDKIIGSSKQIGECLDRLARASSSDVSVLIIGETGTGKELFAQAIHDNSKRSTESFVIVDCAALPETLIESTLFGHVKGAFTGADKKQDGLIKHAHKGTLFLDEVGELPLSIQKTFLRLLQEHEYRPVGLAVHQYSDFRLVAATNRDLDGMAERGEFRKDLLFRLKAFTIQLPPLKGRLEDLKELVTFFISRICERYGIETKGIGTDFLETLAAYDWPGNVRELYQTIEQVLTNPAIGPTCFSIHLPQKIRIQQLRAGFEERHSVSQPSPDVQPWRIFKEQCESEYIDNLRLQSGGNVSKACRLSGLSRTRLYQLINKYNLPFN
jgi:two-component system, NtrC family, response regulator